MTMYCKTFTYQLGPVYGIYAYVSVMSGVRQYVYVSAISPVRQNICVPFLYGSTFT